MSLPDMPGIDTKDPAVDRLVRTVRRFTDALRGKPVIDGQLVTGVSLAAAGTTLVPHMLGRRPVGCAVVWKNGNANVWMVTSTIPDRMLALNCSADVVVSLWVF